MSNIKSSVYVREAIGLACDIRDSDPAEVWAQLDQHDDRHLMSLVVVLAAMVPVDQPVAELLAWTGPGPCQYKVPVGDETRRAHAAVTQARATGQPVPEWARAGEREYNRLRMRDRRSMSTGSPQQKSPAGLSRVCLPEQVAV